MLIQFNDQKRNIVFLVLITLIIVSIFIINNIGNKQDKVLAEENNQYRYALQLLSENKHTEAEPLLNELVEKHPNNDEIIWRYAAVQSNLKNYDKALPLFQKAQDLNVFLIKNSQFLAQFGEALYKAGELEKAKVYLNESVKQNPDEQTLKLVKSLLSEIEKSK